MIDLGTQYMGLALKSPMVASARQLKLKSVAAREPQDRQT